jgi:hypothetical protein
VEAEEAEEAEAEETSRGSRALCLGRGASSGSPRQDSRGAGCGPGTEEGDLRALFLFFVCKSSKVFRGGGSSREKKKEEEEVERRLIFFFSHFSLLFLRETSNSKKTQDNFAKVRASHTRVRPPSSPARGREENVALSLNPKLKQKRVCVVPKRGGGAKDDPSIEGGGGGD